MLETEDDELAMYEHALDRLAEAGLEQYEVSNHALPGSECRHNQTYWANFAYFGFGVGAARTSRAGGNSILVALPRIFAACLAGESPTIQSEALDAVERAAKPSACRCARRQGIDRGGFAAQTGIQLDDLVGTRLSRLAEHGIICDDGRWIAFTRRGFCVADAAIADLLAGALRGGLEQKSNDCARFVGGRSSGSAWSKSARSGRWGRPYRQCPRMGKMFGRTGRIPTRIREWVCEVW